MNFENMSKEELIEYINNLNEEHSGKYGLVWDAEKVPEQVVVDCNKLIPVLKEEESKKIDNGGEDNILIEGDNFHSLSVLNYTHKESIDVIYIDPPYNTGNKDFMYNDCFVDVEDGYRHSKWLNFMSKRLKLARNLLKEDGVIFISIDDNEYAQLKLICDKIFGENNRLSIHHIQVRYENKSLNEDNDWQPVMEYVLIYAKNKNMFKANKPSEPYDLSKFCYKITELTNGEKINVGNKNVTIFRDGEWKIEKEDGKIGLLKETWASGSIVKQSGTAAEFLSKYLIQRKNIDGLNVLYKIDNMGEDGLGYRYVTGPKKIDAIRGKFYSGVPLDRVEEILSGEGSVKTRPISNFHDYSGDFGNIRHEGGISFNSGKKPTKMLKEFINYHTSKNAIILDFFAGSGSTGHAVLELNKEDGGNRKFILCTNNENNICEEITYQRLTNVINGYNGKEGLPGSLRYFKTDFVENNSTRDQIYFDLTEKCVPMLCVKESTFDLVDKTDSYVIYKDKDDINYTCIYFDIHYNHYDEFIEKIKDIKNNKALYIFSLDNRVEEYELDGITNYKVEAIPQKIYDLYRKLVKLSKEN